jgi:hypothetical protein
MHDDWQEYAASTGMTTPGVAMASTGYESASRAGSGEGSPGESQEGTSESRALVCLFWYQMSRILMRPLSPAGSMYSGEGGPTPNKRHSGMSFYPKDAAAAGAAYRPPAYESSDGHSSGSPYGGLAPPEQAHPRSSPRIDDRLNPNAFATFKNPSATSLADENDYSRPILRCALADFALSQPMGVLLTIL